MVRAQVIEALRAFFSSHGSPLVCAYLFGSRAREEAGRGSDLDIVVLNRAAPDLVHRVLRDGVLVHEADCRLRVEFETRRRAE